MVGKYFLWPHANEFKIRSQLSRPRSPELIVDWFERRFSGSHPVVVSSGRAGITACLSALGARRPDHVSIAPYSSACIFRSVGEVATPVPGDLLDEASFELLYHQWGFPHRSNFACPRINDSVDSMIVDGTALFTNAAAYEVVSLAKVIGVPMGAVIFCASEDLRRSVLAVMRSRQGIGGPQYFLRMLSAHSPSALILWDRAESVGGELPAFATGPILAALEGWDAILDDRRAKLRRIASLLPSWLRLDERRLPSAVPIEVHDFPASELQRLRFTPELRHYNASANQSEWDLKRVFPFPIHHEVPIEAVEAAVNALLPVVRTKGTGVASRVDE